MSPDKKLLHMETLEDIIECALYTAPLANTIPISIMLVGLPGTGKSKALLQFDSPSLHVTNDITSAGLSEMLSDDKLGSIRHIAIPDFNIVVSHKQSTSNLTIANLLSVMAEGTMRVDDGRRVKEIFHAPVGIITAMTREVYEVNAGKFLKLGIGRRFCPIFFGYSFATREAVMNAIANGGVTLQQLIPKTLNFPPLTEWPISIGIDDVTSLEIKSIASEMSSNLSYQPKWSRDEESRWIIKPFRGENPIAFTPHMILRTVAQGHALRAGRKEVNKEDLRFIVKFVSFTNYSLPVQL